MFYYVSTPIIYWRYAGNKNGRMMDVRSRKKNMQAAPLLSINNLQLTYTTLKKLYSYYKVLRIIFKNFALWVVILRK